MATISGRAMLVRVQVREDGALGTVRRAWRSGGGRLEAPRSPSTTATADGFERRTAALTRSYDDPMRGGHRGLLR